MTFNTVCMYTGVTIWSEYEKVFYLILNQLITGTVETVPLVSKFQIGIGPMNDRPTRNSTETRNINKKYFYFSNRNHSKLCSKNTNPSSSNNIPLYCNKSHENGSIVQRSS